LFLEFQFSVIGQWNKDIADIEALQRVEYKEFIINLFDTNYLASTLASPSKVIVDSKLASVVKAEPSTEQDEDSIYTPPTVPKAMMEEAELLELEMSKKKRQREGLSLP
jgi:hypothetical protein